jgi:hypothetical protein
MLSQNLAKKKNTPYSMEPHSQKKLLSAINMGWCLRSIAFSISEPNPRIRQTNARVVQYNCHSSGLELQSYGKRLT